MYIYICNDLNALLPWHSASSFDPVSLLNPSKAPLTGTSRTSPKRLSVEFTLHIDIICHAVKGSNTLVYAVEYKDVVNRQLTKQVVKRHFFIEDLHREIYGEVSTTN